MTGAILHAQWLSMRNSRLGASRRGGVFSVLASLLWYGFWGMLAWSAFEFTSDPKQRALVAVALSRGLLLMTLYWQLTPLLVASLGASLDLKKLIVYPVPVEKLFWVEVLLRLTTGKEMVLLLTGASAGLVANPSGGGWPALGRVLPAALAFIVLNLLAAAGTRNLLERLLARKRVREFVVLVMVLAAAVPQFLIVTGMPDGAMQRFFGGSPHPAWPWTAVARVMISGHALLPWVAFAVWIAVAYWFGRWQFARSLRFDLQAARATPAGNGASPFTERLFRLPGTFLPDPIGAMVEKELRTLSRSPRFRLVFIMGFTFGLVIWFPMMLGGSPGRDGFLAQNFLTVLSVYALVLMGQVTYWNNFGFDRSAAQVYFSLPVPMTKTLAAKNIAALMAILLEIAAVTAACLLLRAAPRWERMVEAYLVTLTASIYLLAAGNLASIHLPRPMNPERAGQGGGSGRGQALALVAYPLALLPIVLAYGGRYAFSSNLAFYVLLGFAAILGGMVYWFAMESAVRTAETNRERILTELSRADGPVVSES